MVEVLKVNFWIAVCLHKCKSLIIKDNFTLNGTSCYIMLVMMNIDLQNSTGRNTHGIVGVMVIPRLSYAEEITK